MEQIKVVVQNSVKKETTHYKINMIRENSY
jgi:hypothetical protein